MGDEKFYQQVAIEVMNMDIKPALWAKAFTEFPTDEQKAKAFYIKGRVDQVKQDYVNKVNNIHRESERSDSEDEERNERVERDAKNKASIASPPRETEADNKLTQRKRRHIEAVIKKRLDYLSRGLCIVHGAPRANGSRQSCEECLKQAVERQKRYIAKHKEDK